jgi:hypothetical protein
MNWKSRGVLLLIAVFSSLFGYVVIHNFIFPISIWEYIIIESMITILHLLYNISKEKTIDFFEK